MAFSLASLGISVTRLYGPHGAPTTVGAVYTVPSSGVSAAIVSQITCVNARGDSTVASWSFYIVPSGQTFSSTEHAIVSARPITPGDLPDVIQGPFALGPGDALHAVASSGALDLTVSGVILP